MTFDITRLRDENDIENDIVTDIHITTQGEYSAKVNGIVIVTKDYGYIKQEIEKVWR